MATDYSKLAPIYLVTVMIVDEEGRQRRGRRTWGWHPTLDDAKQAVMTNDGDMFENDYNLVVIEEAYAGSLTLAENRWWFEVVRDPKEDPEGAERGWICASGAKEIPEPAWAKHTINFGIG